MSFETADTELIVLVDRIDRGHACVEEDLSELRRTVVATERGTEDEVIVSVDRAVGDGRSFRANDLRNSSALGLNHVHNC